MSTVKVYLEGVQIISVPKQGKLKPKTLSIAWQFCGSRFCNASLK